jgi:Pyridoxal phosphate biosynthesis protein
VRAAKEAGADSVELHTGSYAEAFRRHGASSAELQKELGRLIAAGGEAQKLGLELHGGHGLDYRNVVPVARIPGMRELNIGFAIIARSVFVGLDRAVREMKDLIE